MSFGFYLHDIMENLQEVERQRMFPAQICLPGCWEFNYSLRLGGACRGCIPSVPPRQASHVMVSTTILWALGAGGTTKVAEAWTITQQATGVHEELLRREYCEWVFILDRPHSKSESLESKSLGVGGWWGRYMNTQNCMQKFVYVWYLVRTLCSSNRSRR